MSDGSVLMDEIAKLDDVVDMIETQKAKARAKKTRVEKMQSIDEKIARLQKRKERLEAQETEARRRIETRCKILAGATILKLLLSDEQLSKRIIADAIKFSATRESEKVFFEKTFGDLA